MKWGRESCTSWMGWVGVLSSNPANKSFCNRGILWFPFSWARKATVDTIFKSALLTCGLMADILDYVLNWRQVPIQYIVVTYTYIIEIASFFCFFGVICILNQRQNLAENSGVPRMKQKIQQKFNCSKCIKLPYFVYFLRFNYENSQSATPNCMTTVELTGSQG